MTKAEERAALEAMLAKAKVATTKVEAAPMDASLSASFKALGIDKKRQQVKPVRIPRGQEERDQKPVRPRRPRPNWELQRRYDEEHGTVNGYDPNIEAWRSFHDGEMDVD